ncbi:MAG TPA: hypothetical protein VHZ53_00190, partial [Steroidobacteraceae bacterium]|nr:hypothetical protein [Steroidobacteraceae bacterium]
MTPAGEHEGLFGQLPRAACRIRSACEKARQRRQLLARETLGEIEKRILDQPHMQPAARVEPLRAPQRELEVIAGEVAPMPPCQHRRDGRQQRREERRRAADGSHGRTVRGVQAADQPVVLGELRSQIGTRVHPEGSESCPHGGQYVGGG